MLGDVPERPPPPPPPPTEGGAKLRPANGLEDITDERNDWPGLLPRLSEAVLRETEGRDVTDADVASVGIDARRFCSALTGM